MTTPSLLVLMAATTATMTNTGRSAQNRASGVRSSPGQPETSGRSNQDAAVTGRTSYNPKNEATAHPARIPLSGAHSRQTPVARNAIAVVTTSVAPATTRGPAAGAPSGASAILPTAIGMTVTAINMSAVPDTIGVTSRRRNGSHAAMANWNSDETTTRLASVGSPPSVSATTETAMKWGPAPVIRTWPAPHRPTWAACRAVETPATINAAKTAHVR